MAEHEKSATKEASQIGNMESMIVLPLVIVVKESLFWSKSISRFLWLVVDSLNGTRIVFVQDIQDFISLLL